MLGQDRARQDCPAVTIAQPGRDGDAARPLREKDRAGRRPSA
jgi:hypothetical protein